MANKEDYKDYTKIVYILTLHTVGSKMSDHTENLDFEKDQIRISTEFTSLY